MSNDEWQDWPATVDDPLDIPEFLRIPQERRSVAWDELRGKVMSQFSKTLAHLATDDKGPGSTCRKAGIPDGIDQDLVERSEMVEAAKEAKSKASLYEMDERRKQEKAERESVREAVRKSVKRRKRR